MRPRVNPSLEAQSELFSSLIHPISQFPLYPPLIFIFSIVIHTSAFGRVVLPALLACLPACTCEPIAFFHVSAAFVCHNSADFLEVEAMRACVYA